MNKKSLEKRLFKIVNLLERNKYIDKIVNLTALFFDEPKLYRYMALPHPSIELFNKIHYFENIIGVGVSFFSPQLALTKCLMESIELFGGIINKEKEEELYISSYNTIKNKALNPNIFQKNYCVLGYDNATLFKNNAKIGWIKGVDLTRGREVFIPAQLVYYNYTPSYAETMKGLKEHFILYGEYRGAAGFNMVKVLLRGIYEIIQLDSYIVSHLLKIVPLSINLDYVKRKNSKLKEVIRITNLYNLELSLFMIPNDFGIPVIMAMLIDRTGFGPALNLGLKAGFNLEEVVLGAIEEAYNSRFAVRYEMIYFPHRLTKIDLDTIENWRVRGLFWARKQTLESIAYLLKSKKKEEVRELHTRKFRDEEEELKYVIKILANHGFDIYYVDITPKVLKQLNIHTIRVIIPNLQVSYRSEGARIICFRRLQQLAEFFKIDFDLNELNKLPHLMV